MKHSIYEIKYEPEDDVLNVFFSKNKIEDSFEVDPHSILHTDEKNNPVYLEIFEASKNFNFALKNLPEKIEQQFFASV